MTTGLEQRTCCPTTPDQEHLTDLCTGPVPPRPLDPGKVCRVLEEVFEARRRLHVVHGEQNHDDGTSYAHLRKAYRAAVAQDDTAALRGALLELAATAVEWVEAIDRRGSL